MVLFTLLRFVRGLSGIPSARLTRVHAKFPEEQELQQAATAAGRQSAAEPNAQACQQTLVAQARSQRQEYQHNLPLHLSQM